MELSTINYDAISYSQKSYDEIQSLQNLYSSSSLQISFCSDVNGFVENFPQIQYLGYRDILILKKRGLYNFYYESRTFRDRFDGCKIISDDDAQKVTGKQKRATDLTHLLPEKSEDGFIPLALLMQDASLKPSHSVTMTDKEYKTVLTYIRENRNEMTSTWFCDLTDWKDDDEQRPRVLVAEEYSDLLYIYMNIA